MGEYLQGEFQAALETWRELLELDPEDDRALEGVKLCKMLAEDEGSQTAPAAEPTKAPAPAASASIEGFDDDLEELDAILDRVNLPGPERSGGDEQVSDGPEPGTESRVGHE